MSQPSRAARVISLLWAVLIAIGIIALAGSVMMPSTKRARVDWDQLRRLEAEESAAAAAASAASAATMPADQIGGAAAQPSTRPTAQP